MKTSQEVRDMINNLSANNPNREVSIDNHIMVKTLEWVLSEHDTDPIVQAVCDKMIARSRQGQTEYGTTLEENNAPALEKLDHLQQELMDGALYTQWLKKEFIHSNERMPLNPRTREMNKAIEDHKTITDNQ